MKKITALLLFLLCIFSALSLAACNKAPSGKTVYIGEESVVFPEGVEQVTFSLPENVQCLYTAEDGREYDLYKEDRETLMSLSQSSYGTKFPNLEDKQMIADLSAGVFSELYPEKEIICDGVCLTIRTNPFARCLICRGEGNDGGFATLAIDKETGEILMITYGD